MGVVYDPATKMPVTVEGGSLPAWWAALGQREQQELSSEPVGSPLWWLYRGLARLTVERVVVQECEDYWHGVQPLPVLVNADTKQKYADLIEEAKLNYMDTVVDVISGRLRMQGLWIPGDDERADSETWAMWEENGLVSWQSTAFAEMVAKRRCYWSVGVNETDGGMPRIEIEDALDTWVEMVPGSRTERAAGIKTFVDDWTGEAAAEVMLPDAVHYFRETPAGWKEWRDPAVNTLGVVPLIPMTNRPTIRTSGVGRSEIEGLLRTQDRILRTVLGRSLAGETAAFAQKWAIGIEIEEDADGKPISPYRNGSTELWTSENPNARFGQFDPTDPGNYIKSEEQDLQHIVNTTRIPRHNFNPSGQEPSGDSMKSADHGLDSKIASIQSFSEAPLKEVLALGRKAWGKDTPLQSEIVWEDTSFQTFAQLVDGLSKLKQENVVSRAYMQEKIGMSPATMSRVTAEINTDQFMADALSPTETAAPDAAPTV